MVHSANDDERTADTNDVSAARVWNLYGALRALERKSWRDLLERVGAVIPCS